MMVARQFDDEMASDSNTALSHPAMRIMDIEKLPRPIRVTAALSAFPAPNNAR